MKKVSVILSAFVLSAGVVFVACKKDAASVSDSEVASAQETTIASAIYDDVDAEVDAATSSASTLKSAAEDTSAPVVKTRSKTGLSWTREIAFNNITRNKKLKSGKIIVAVTYASLSDSTNEKAWTKVITFENYIVGGRTVEGTKTISYKGLVDGVPTWEVKLTDGKVTFKNGKTMTFYYTRTRKMIEGVKTPLVRADDVFQFDGAGGGTNKKGETFTTSSVALLKAFGCPYFKSGTLTHINTATGKTTVVSYQGGTDCSPSATVTVDGVVKTINTDEETN